MKKDALHLLLDEVEQQCVERGIGVFYGDIEAGLQTTVQWNKKGDGDWQQFLNVLSHSGSKVLIVTAEQNDLDTEEQYLLDYLDDLEQDLQPEYRTALKVVNKTTGQLASFTLTFFQGAIQFELQKRASWYDDYLLVREAYEADEEDEEDPPASNNKMSEEEIEQWARKIINLPHYLSAKDRMERNRITWALLEQEGIDKNNFDTYNIQRKAEHLFVEEVQPVQEQELSTKIKELKAQGLKKIEVCGKLGISQSTLNRHWY